MDELQVGDEVFDENGTVCQVIAIGSVFRNRESVLLRFNNGTAIIADGEHEWEACLCRKQGKFNLYTSRILAKTRAKRALIKVTKALDLPDASLPINPYVLGVWLGDGCSNHATITQGESDITWLRKTIEHCGYRTSSRSTPLTFGILGLSKQLRVSGLLGNKHIPMLYLRASRSQRTRLLQGLIDTDGHVSKSGMTEFCSTDKGIAESVQELVHSLGRRATLFEGRSILQGRDHGPKYRVMFYFSEAALMPRKRKWCKDGTRTPNWYVDGESCISDTKCIQVSSPSGMFLAGKSMIPTHNSELVGRYFPAWHLGTFPAKRVAYISYQDDHAARFSRLAKDCLTKYGPALFGVNISQSSSAANRWSIAGEEGGMFACGIGGAIMGKRPHCLPAGTMIDTERGKIPIEILVASALRPRVRGFDHDSQRTVWRDITATQESWANEIFEIVTDRGNTVWATGEHRFYVDRSGYRKAADLRPGDRLVSQAIKIKQNLPHMRNSGPAPRASLRPMLSTCQNRKGHIGVRKLRNPVRTKRSPKQQSRSTWMRQRLLFTRLPVQSSRCHNGPSLRNLQRSNAQKRRSPLLFKSMPAIRTSIRRSNMRSMWFAISSPQPKDAILFSPMRQRGTLDPNARGRKFSLQVRGKLRKVVHGDAPFGHGQGRVPMRGLPYSGISKDDLPQGTANPTNESADSPRRPQPAKQCPGQSRHSLRDVPLRPSQIETDTVAMVRRICNCRVRVYDIQVEGTHNFFANGLLVHNCMILDDPIKNAEEAMSQTVRDSLWDWLQSTALERLEPNGAIIIIMHRWHRDDLVGRFKEQYDGHCRVITLPALAEENDQMGRKLGESIWPERFSQKDLEFTREKKPLYWWLALYQQRPGAQGNAEWPAELFTRAGLWFDVWPDDLLLKTIALDPSKGGKGKSKGKTKNSDYSAFVLMGFDRAGNIWIEGDLQRRPPGQIVEDGVEHARRFLPNLFGIEDNAFQDLFLPMFRDAGRRLGFSAVEYVGVNNTVNKETRIRRLDPFLRAGRLRFRNTPGTRLLFQQLREFPLGTHDDGPDAAEMALRIIDELLDDSDKFHPERITT